MQTKGAYGSRRADTDVTRAALTRRLMLLPCVTAVLLMLAACGGGMVPINESLDSPEGTAAVLHPAPAPSEGTALAEALLQLDDLPVPEGMSADDFSQLKSTLREFLTARGTSEFVPSVPIGAEHQVKHLAPLYCGESAIRLTWKETLSGDYNLDGQVNVSDLTVVGQRYGQSCLDGIDDAWDKLADGNGNGLVEIADITPIGRNFYRTVCGYKVYRRPAEREEEFALVGSLLRTEAQLVEHAAVVYVFADEAIDPEATYVYEVRPFAQTLDEGEPSQPLLTASWSSYGQRNVTQAEVIDLGIDGHEIYALRNEVLVTFPEQPTPADIAAVVSVELAGCALGQITDTNTVRVAVSDARHAVSPSGLVRSSFSRELPSGVTVEYQLCLIDEQRNDREKTASKTYSDREREYQWGLDAVHANEAWDLGGEGQREGQGVTVAVIETTGVDTDHPDLDHRYVEGFVVGNDLLGLLGGSSWKPDSPDQFHGTGVAGIIAAEGENLITAEDTQGWGIVGLANRAMILPVKLRSITIDLAGVVTHTVLLGDLAEAIRLLTDPQDDRIHKGTRVINISLGLNAGESETLTAAIREAVEQGVVVVAASGNNDGPANVAPAMTEPAISVAAVQETEGPAGAYTRWEDQEMGEGSNYNTDAVRTVDIAAPGGLIVTTVPVALGNHLSLQGTSYAAPFVSAAAALLIAAQPDLGAPEVREVLLNTTTDITTDHDIGELLNAEAAMAAVVPVANLECQARGDGSCIVDFDASGSRDPRSIVDYGLSFEQHIAAYRWDWDNDWFTDQVSGGTAFHQYPGPGTYTAAVTVVDNHGGTDRRTVTFTISEDEPPVAALSAEPSAGVAPLTVDFDASASSDPEGEPLAGFEWDFDGDGDWDQDSGQDPTAAWTYSAAGDFNATVRVTDAAGLTGTASVLVTVSDAGSAPVAVLEASPGSGSAPLYVTLNAGASHDDGLIVLYEWDFAGEGFYKYGDGQASFMGYTYEAAGDYCARVRVTDDDGLTDIDTVLIAVGEPGGPDQPTITSLAPNPAGIGSTLTIGGTGLGEADGSNDYNGWTARFGGGATVPPYQIDYWRATEVKLRVPDGAHTGSVYLDYGTQQSNSLPLTVNLKVYEVQPDKTYGLAGITTFNFSCLVDGGTAPYSFLWEFDDGETSTAQNPPHVYSLAGTYFPQVTVFDSAGAQKTEPVCAITVDPADTPMIESIWPEHQKAGGSDTLAGLNFGDSQGQSVVLVGTIEANVVSWSDGEIVFTMPAVPPEGLKDVTVRVGTKTSNAVQVYFYSVFNFHFTDYINNDSSYYLKLCEGDAIGGLCYSAGGVYNGSVTTSAILSYDPPSKDWDIVGSLAKARHSHQVVALNGKLYSIGGWATDIFGQWKASGTIERFDPATGQSTLLEHGMNRERMYFGAAAWNGRIYVFGGNDPDSAPSYFADCEYYDPAADLWTAVESMPNPTYATVATTLGDKIYVLYGGGDGQGFRVYDPVADDWTVKYMEGFEGYQGAVALTVGTYIYGIKPNRQIWRYDPATDESEYVGLIDGWNIGPPKYSGSAVVGGRIYYWGGDTSPMEHCTAEGCV